MGKPGCLDSNCSTPHIMLSNSVYCNTFFLVIQSYQGLGFPGSLGSSHTSGKAVFTDISSK